MFLPLHGKDQAQPKLFGFAVAAFRVRELILAARADRTAQEIDLYLCDDTDPAERIVLYPSGSRLEQDTAAPRRDMTVHFAGRRLTLIAVATPQYLKARSNSQPWLILLTGLLCSSLLAAYLSNVSGRTARVERLVRERTAQLAESNRALESEIAERKGAEWQAQQAEAAAQSANAAKSRFLAQMSHEIRTPLNGILGSAELLRRGIGSQQQQKFLLNTIRSSGKHLLALIDEILDLSKIEAGRMEFERVRCSPHQIISEVLSTMRVASQQKGLSLEGRWTSGIPEMILTDPHRLRQLLLNLVGNAIKFTERGGVTLLFTVHTSWPEPRFVIEVQDTGMGIAPDQIQDIFQPFHQAHMTVTRHFGGTGLGLAISQYIARGLGGDITVQSEVDRGSVFRVTLETGPLEEVRILDSPPSEAFTSSSGHKPAGTNLSSARILLIEDGETNRELIKLVLCDAGASVVCAENGQLGLDAANREPFDLILMDVQMPVMDGYTATQCLRQQGCTIPIIALTAHAMRGDEQKCLEAGCSGYLSKPVDIDLLLKTVADALAPTSTGATDSVRAAERAPESADNARHADPMHNEHRRPAGTGMHEATGTDQPITSSLSARRPEIRWIIENFVDKLQETLQAMQVAHDASDWDELAELAHWLKGAGGTIGFNCFTEPACRLEQVAKDQQSDGAGKTIQEIAELAGRVVVSP